MTFGGDWIAGKVLDPSSILQGNFGLENLRFEAKSNLYFDVASLTKIIVTSTLLAEMYVKSSMSWERFGEVALQTKIPELKNTPLADLKIMECWNHQSGLQPFKNFSEDPRNLGLSDRNQVWTQVLKGLVTENLKTRGEVVYSDLGFLLLGLFLERSLEKDLSQAWEDWKKPRGLSQADLCFKPKNISALVPTETRHPTGEVNDDRAALLNGIAPHAGLFSSALGVWAWLEKISQEIKENSKFKNWISAQGPLRFHGGWDRPQNPLESHAGEGWSPAVIGHLGYTGTSLWWDPVSGIAGVLLTNRVFPKDSENNRMAIKRLRRSFYTLLWEGKVRELWEVFRRI